MVFMSSVTAFAVDTSNTNGTTSVDNPDQAINMLSTKVQSVLSSKQYKAEGGGKISGSDLFTGWDYDSGSAVTGVGNNTSGYTVDESNFSKLTGAAQSEFVKDIAKESYNTVDSVDGVDEDTVENWWKDLQTRDGLGSKFLNVVLENTKPDFVSANRIYKPFSGLIGTVMGLIAVVGMGLLGVVLVADIFYIVIPPIRMLVSENEDTKGGKFAKSKVFSADAIYAIKVAEEGDGDGNKKQALGIYLGRRVPMLILLGICLLYLVSGNIYTLVGMILDLVSGFLGF